MDATLTAAVARVLAGAQGEVLVGFSGGLDSTVLLHLVAHAANPGLAPIAVHVNHGLQPEADRWQAHCERVATELGVGFAAHRVRVERGGSVEAAARSARYAVFRTCLAAPHSLLLLAHHRDDQTETVLLRLLQGRGLYGMPAARPCGAGHIDRPLLETPRVVLERYARAHSLEWCEDPSNADLGLDRNYVRHRLLPELRARFPGIDAALLGALAVRQADDAARLQAPIAALGAATLPIAELLARESDEQLVWLRLWLTAHGHASPPGRALRELLRQLGAATDRQPRLALDRGELRRHGGRLWLVAPTPKLADRYPLPTSGRLALPHGVLAVSADPAGFAYCGALEVRFRAGGERIRSGGHQRTVKQLLQAGALPPWARAHYPLLFDAAGLVAVPGIAQRDGDAAADLARYRAEWIPAD